MLESVVRHLSWDPEITSREIGICACDGVVTLTGTVGSHREKTAAELTVKRVHGVRAVVNDIQVVGEGAITDCGIARAALAVLDGHIGVPRDGIIVTVRNGEVTLEGAVEWDFQRQRAAAALQGLPGLSRLSNQIEVRSPVSLAEAKSRVENALGRVDPGVTVQTNGSQVRLSGIVGTWAEREAIERAAWSSSGATRVEDEVMVTGPTR